MAGLPRDTKSRIHNQGETKREEKQKRNKIKRKAKEKEGQQQNREKKIRMPDKELKPIPRE